MTSGLEFLFQALGVPALVPLPTGKKYKEKEDLKVTLGKTFWWKQHPILMGVWHIPFNQFQGTGYSTILNVLIGNSWFAITWQDGHIGWQQHFGEFALHAVEGKTFGFDNQPGRLDIGCKQVIRSFKAHVSRGPFLKSPFNSVWEPKSNIQFKILAYKEWKRESLLKSQSILFCNWYFYHIICKTIETSTLNVYKTIFSSRELSGLSRNGSHMKGMWKFKRTSQR